jgi:hypothetical protein
VNATLEDAVRSRSLAQCEYCQFPEAAGELSFHIDHIISQQHGGQTVSENLALACPYCNRFKGPNLAGIDSITGAVTPLFHPRLEQWSDHFSWNGPVLMGLTPTGRATVAVLKINSPEAVELRRLLQLGGDIGFER